MDSGRIVLSLQAGSSGIPKSIDDKIMLPYNAVRNKFTVQVGAMTSRLDVRLEPEHRRRLEELALDRGMPISEVVRCLIDGAYDEILRERRRQAVERITALNIEDPPDPETLSRQLEDAHDPGDLY